MTLEIQYTALNNMEITPALRDLTQTKLERILGHISKNILVQVTFNVEKLRQIVQAHVHLHGADINAIAESDDMYKSIDELIAKIDRQVTKYRDKQTEHR